MYLEWFRDKISQDKTSNSKTSQETEFWKDISRIFQDRVGIVVQISFFTLWSIKYALNDVWHIVNSFFFQKIMIFSSNSRFLPILFFWRFVFSTLCPFDVLSVRRFGIRCFFLSTFCFLTFCFSTFYHLTIFNDRLKLCGTVFNKLTNLKFKLIFKTSFLKRYLFNFVKTSGNFSV